MSRELILKETPYTGFTREDARNLAKTIKILLDALAEAMNATAIPLAAAALYDINESVAKKATIPTVYSGIAFEVLGLIDNLLTRYDSPRLKFFRDLFNNLGVTSPSAVLFAFLTIVAVYCDIEGTKACNDAPWGKTAGMGAGAVAFGLLQATQGLAKMDFAKKYTDKITNSHLIKIGKLIGAILNSAQNAGLLVSLAQVIEEMFSFKPSDTYKVFRYSGAILLGSSITYGQAKFTEGSAFKEWFDRLINLLSALVMFWQIYAFPFMTPISLALPIIVTLATVYLVGLPKEKEYRQRADSLNIRVVGNDPEQHLLDNADAPADYGINTRTQPSSGRQTCWPRFFQQASENNSLTSTTPFRFKDERSWSRSSACNLV